MDVQDRPWAALPLEAHAALAPHLPALAEEIVAAIAAEVPVYARPLERGSNAVRRGVHDALARFVELARGGRDVESGTPAADLGGAEVRAGRSLDALLTAYRVGARVAWRRLAALGLAAGLAPETLVLLAESIFAYIDELSAESAEGYAREQAERAGELERRRRTLVELLVAARAADPTAVAAAAEAAHWRLPSALVVAVWRDGSARLEPDALSATVEGLRCAVVPGHRAFAEWAPGGAPGARDTSRGPFAERAPGGAAGARDTSRGPFADRASGGAPVARDTVRGPFADPAPGPAGPGSTDTLRRVLAGRVAGIGPTVGWAEAGRSFRLACAALALAEDRGLHVPVLADEHRVALLWRAEPALVAELSAERLAPLAFETPRSRARLEATLLAWLRNAGSVAVTAGDLRVHPQTVRYRLARLRELLGGALDDPDARFELELVLRARPVTLSA